MGGRRCCCLFGHILFWVPPCSAAGWWGVSPLLMLCDRLGVSFREVKCGYLGEENSSWHNLWYPRKFYYEESSFMSSNYLIELHDKKHLHVIARWTEKETLDCWVDYYSTPSEEQWEIFEKTLYMLNLEPLVEQGICDGTWGDIWITFRRRVKSPIQLGPYEKLEPLHRAINPLTKCSEYPRGIFSWL